MYTHIDMDSNTCSRSVICVRQISEPFLVVPAEPTPKEIKKLSDIDDQEWLRKHHSIIMFYKGRTNNNKMRGGEEEGEDPAKVIVRGISKALIQYYPMAGRIIEGPNRKLFVDCNDEGVLFVEAEADVTLEDLGDSIAPPCPYIKQFVHHVPCSDGFLGCPLLIFQVTRFSCGGFALAVGMNHVICDTVGLLQFLKTVASIAKNRNSPPPPPVWQRDLIFTAHDPPRITCIHHEYDNSFTVHTKNDLTHDSVFFGPKQIHTLRNHLPKNLRNCSNFELISACLWKCRTLALNMNQNEVVVAFSPFISARGKIRVPKGYYGNAFGFPAAVTKASSLCENPLEYALGLIREAKGRMCEEYMRSLASHVTLQNRPMYRSDAGHFLLGDTTRVGFDRLDFGWGGPVYGGPAGAFDHLISFLAPFRNGIVVPVMLPKAVMRRFLLEVVKMTSDYYYYYDELENDQLVITCGTSKL